MNKLPIFNLPANIVMIKHVSLQNLFISENFTFFKRKKYHLIPLLRGLTQNVYVKCQVQLQWMKADKRANIYIKSYMVYHALPVSCWEGLQKNIRTEDNIRKRRNLNYCEFEHKKITDERLHWPLNRGGIKNSKQQHRKQWKQQQ